MITVKYPEMTYPEFLKIKIKLEGELLQLEKKNLGDTIGAEMIRIRIQILKDANPVESMQENYDSYETAKAMAENYFKNQ